MSSNIKPRAYNNQQYTGRIGAGVQAGMRPAATGLAAHLDTNDLVNGKGGIADLFLPNPERDYRKAQMAKLQAEDVAQKKLSDLFVHPPTIALSDAPPIKNYKELVSQAASIGAAGGMDPEKTSLAVLLANPDMTEEQRSQLFTIGHGALQKDSAIDVDQQNRLRSEDWSEAARSRHDTEAAAMDRTNVQQAGDNARLGQTIAAENARATNTINAENTRSANAINAENGRNAATNERLARESAKDPAALGNSIDQALGIAFDKNGAQTGGPQIDPVVRGKIIAGASAKLDAGEKNREKAVLDTLGEFGSYDPAGEKHTFSADKPSFNLKPTIGTTLGDAAGAPPPPVAQPVVPPDGVDADPLGLRKKKPVI